MKKLIVFILALVYFTEASGVRLHLHYCRDRLVSWGLQQERNCPSEQQSKCSSCHHMKGRGDCHLAPKDCCKDEYKFLKQADAQKTEKVFAPKPLITEAACIFPVPEASSLVRVNRTAANLINGQPRSPKVPVFLFHCIFRI
jgi:hypothetical protein